MPIRKVIHIDMDCFYAAVEIRDRPELQGKPVAVGGSGRRGVLTTCNYVARKYGCHSGMPGFKAIKQCPDLIMLPVNFEKYIRESKKVREILASYSEVIETLSLDEAFIDVSENKDRYAWDIAKEMRERIYGATKLTASAGVAPNKMLAKIASDWRKPNGQFAILPDEVDSFMKNLPVSKIWGVGRKTRERMERMGLVTCGDLQAKTMAELTNTFGKFGEQLHELCRGVDHREVCSSRDRKSMSSERTFYEDLTQLDDLMEKLQPMVAELQQNLSASKHSERELRKVFVKLKFSDFSRTSKECVYDQIEKGVFQRLAEEAWERGNGRVRLLGVGVRFSEIQETEDNQMRFHFTPDSAGMQRVNEVGAP